jgi:hypothetical protein
VELGFRNIIAKFSVSEGLGFNELMEVTMHEE